MSVDDRITHLERTVRRQRLWGAVVLVALVGWGFYVPPGVADEVRARRVVVVNAEGNDAVVLGYDELMESGEVYVYDGSKDQNTLALISELDDGPTVAVRDPETEALSGLAITDGSARVFCLSPAATASLSAGDGGALYLEDESGSRTVSVSE